MTDPVIAGATEAIVARVTEAIIKTGLIDSIRDGVVDFLAGRAKDLGEEEIADLIAKLRSDARLREQIQQATERAVERWASDCPDRDLVIAVAESTKFANLPSVEEAIRTVAQRPFDPVAEETLRGKFDEVLPSRFEAARVERGVAELLEFLQEEFAGVSALREAQAVAAAIRTARDTRLIVTLLEQMLAGPTPTEETLHNYLAWVVDQHRYLDPRGTMQTVRQVQVLLDDIYVSLTAEAEPALSAIDRRLYEDELEALLAREDLGSEEKEDLRENLLARYVQGEETRPRGELVELNELVREHPLLVILGDPGAGKTTLLRYLALRHAQALRKGENEIEALGPTRLPLYLRIAGYAEYGDGRSLLDFLPTSIRGEHDSDERLAKLIRERLAEGNCLVLLDGLDEVIKPDQRAKIADQINAFIRAHEKKGNRFVVTSRVAGYRSAPLAGDMAHYRVRDMNADQIRRFLEQWCHAVERFQTPDLSPQAQAEKAQAEIDSITQAIEANPGVRRLATNPLLLRTLALIHRTGARLPQRRIELYRLAADTLIRDWQLAKGVPEAALVHEAEATRLLAELAAWMHQEKPAGIAAQGEVRARLAEVKGRLVGKEPDRPDVLIAVDDFLKRIREHTGLFVERAPRCYGFMHLTFEEYFAARWLVARPRQAARRIRAKLHRPRWEEPILLAIGFYGMEFPDDVDDLIEEAILGKNLGGPSSHEDILHRDLLFAVRCLGDQDVSVGLRKRLINEFSQHWLGQGSKYGYGFVWRRMEENAQALRGSPAEATLRGFLLTALQDESEDVRRSAASILSNVTAQPEVISALLTALKDESEHVRSSAASALSNATAQPEVVSALLAALKDESEDVRDSATYALRNATAQPEVVSALLTALQDESEGVCISAAHALRDATLTTEAASALVAALKEQREYVRDNAAIVLQESTLTAEAVPTLVAALKDESKHVRDSAASALYDATVQPEVVSALLAALKDESEDVRSRVAYMLKLDDRAKTQPEVVSSLLAALKDESEHVRSSAASILSNATAQPEVISALLTALKDEGEHVRGRAAYALRNATAQPEVISALLVALKDESEDVRSRAAYALHNATAQPEVASALLVALKDESEDVRSSAASALRDATVQPEVISALLTALKDESEDVRRSAASALRDATAQPEVISALLTALKDESEDVRRSAASALRDATAQPEVISALLTALKDESEHVRSSAASALSNATAQREIVSALVAALQDDAKYARFRVARALSDATLTAETVPVLLAAFKDVSEDVRSRMAYMLKLDDRAKTQPEVVSGLLVALKDESEDVRSSAASALRDATAQPEVISALLTALKDESEDVRRSAAFALRDATAQPEVISALLVALKDESVDVRGRAAYALRNATAQPEVISALLTALKDESEDVRRSAASALSDAIAQPEVISALLAALKDENKGVRDSAASALSDARRNAQLTTEAVSALLTALKDESEDVRSAAASILTNATAQPEVISALLAALKDENKGVRDSAASALRDARRNAQLTIEAVSALLAAFKDESADVRRWAGYMLHDAPLTAEAISALLAVLKDESEDVRSSAASALSDATAQPEVIFALLAALKDESKDVRERAAFALSQLARHPTAALLPNLPQQLAASLGFPGLGGWSRNALIEALLTIAPGPQVE